LQNNDGGWPTFCRGWGALPFDRSTPDLTAHALRSLYFWREKQVRDGVQADGSNVGLISRIDRAVPAGFAYLARTQRSDGTWFPLWFGNQFSQDEENPVYGVARVLAAYRDWNRLNDSVPQSAITWLADTQNSDGGWGGAKNTPSSTEETALAVEALLPLKRYKESCDRGLEWLLDRVESGTFQNPSPIGLYFAKLWYFERLYPIIFTVSVLARAIEQADQTQTESSGSTYLEEGAAIPSSRGKKT
jgi:squalene-hopene/tetraprenyl-beta-curcumene cyclase